MTGDPTVKAVEWGADVRAATYANHSAWPSYNGPLEVTCNHCATAVEAARAVWLEQAERAMFGDTDGGMVEDDAQLPVGELRRLLHKATS